MQIEFKQKGNVGLIELKGDLNVVQVDAFREAFKNWFTPNPAIKNVVVDLSQVPMIDSAGLGLLIAFLKQIRERDGDLHLAGLQKRVRLVFEITRTKRIFGIYDSQAEAVAAFDNAD